MDPRARLLVCLAWLVAVALAPGWPWLGGLAVLGLLLRAPLRLVLQRSALVLPFLLGAVTLPFVVPGPGWEWAGWHVSALGLERLGQITVRTLLSVAGVVTLGFYTSGPRLLWAVSRLGMPALLVSILGLMLRYLFVLGDELGRMRAARASRSARLPGRPGGLGWWGELRVAGMMLGSLLLRALDRSERVYQAMLARGYDGRPRLLETPRFSGRDGGVVLLSWALVGLLAWAR